MIDSGSGHKDSPVSPRYRLASKASIIEGACLCVIIDRKKALQDALDTRRGRKPHSPSASSIPG